LTHLEKVKELRDEEVMSLLATEHCPDLSALFVKIPDVGSLMDGLEKEYSSVLLRLSVMWAKQERVNAKLTSRTAQLTKVTNSLRNIEQRLEVSQTQLSKAIADQLDVVIARDKTKEELVQLNADVAQLREEAKRIRADITAMRATGTRAPQLQPGASPPPVTNPLAPGPLPQRAGAAPPLAASSVPVSSTPGLTSAAIFNALRTDAPSDVRKALQKHHAANASNDVWLQGLADFLFGHIRHGVLKTKAVTSAQSGYNSDMLSTICSFIRKKFKLADGRGQKKEK
jgi:hypothetical protein